MLELILPYLQCPCCTGTPLKQNGTFLLCGSCGARHPISGGIPDLIGVGPAEVITPFQRVMQTPLVVSIYEGIWRRAGYYVASSRSFEQEIRTVLQLSRRGNNLRTLDLACGPGVFTRPLAKQSAGIVVGLDLSWPMLRYALRRVQSESLENISLIRGSAFRLPFLPGSFTSVNCCGALHLFDKPDEALKEIQRVLCPNGYLTVQTTIRPERSGGLAYFLERFIRFGFFQEECLRRKMDSCGFEILESERHRISFTFLARRPGTITEPRPLGSG
jgi:SAM-dependent methyltransferase